MWALYKQAGKASRWTPGYNEINAIVYLICFLSADGVKVIFLF